jgi:hypothetical protein
MAHVEGSGAASEANVTSPIGVNDSVPPEVVTPERSPLTPPTLVAGPKPFKKLKPPAGSVKLISEKALGT